MSAELRDSSRRRYAFSRSYARELSPKAASSWFRCELRVPPMGVPADGSIRAFRTLILEVIWYSIGSCADSADGKASEETRRAELVDGIARDFHDG